MQIYTIYIATNKINQKQYVGFDSNWPKRQQDHKNTAFNPKNLSYKTAFHNAIHKHGWDNFEWNILYQSRDKDHTLSEMERHFIAEYNTFAGFDNCNGYNLTLGGEGRCGHKHSDESRQKISVARRGKPGHKRSEETQKKMLAVHKGKKRSEEARNKMSLAKKGKPSQRSRQISTPFGIFDGVSIAATTLGLNETTLINRLKRASFPDWYYVDDKTPTDRNTNPSRLHSTNFNPLWNI